MVRVGIAGVDIGFFRMRAGQRTQITLSLPLPFVDADEGDKRKVYKTRETNVEKMSGCVGNEDQVNGVSGSSENIHLIFILSGNAT